MAPRATTAGPTTGAGVKVCEQCQKLREVYRQAIGRVARLERLNNSLGADAVLEVVHSLAAKIEEAEQARTAARDALQRHQIERGHS